jgi:glyoxylase I family protein
MPTFAGINHVALTVTDLDVSERFYTEVLGFRRVLDVGHGRITIDAATGFTLALLRHPDAVGGSFTELATGLDHLGLAAADRGELEEWEARLRDAGVPYTPIRDMPLGHHLNFRDPDGIALELYAPSEAYAAALAELRTRDLDDDELQDAARRLVGMEAPTA